MKKSIWLMSLVLMNLVSYSQESKPYHEFNNLKLYADTLKKLGHEILYGETDSIRIVSNQHFHDLFEKALELDNSFLFPCDSVTNVSNLTSPDNTFRIMTWNMPAIDGSGFNYYGFVQTFNMKKNTSKLFPLIDRSDTMSKPQNTRLNPDNWYGQVYYKMIPCKKGGKKYYTLLGIHWINKLKTQKILETVSVSKDKIVFGSPVFKVKKTFCRMLFTYSAQVVMALRYDATRNSITYDHLLPGDPSLEGQYEFYGPDGSYDELIYKSGIWVLKQDVDARNPKDNTSTKPMTPMEGNNGK